MPPKRCKLNKKEFDKYNIYTGNTKGNDAHHFYNVLFIKSQVELSLSNTYRICIKLTKSWVIIYTTQFQKC